MNNVLIPFYSSSVNSVELVKNYAFTEVSEWILDGNTNYEGETMRIRDTPTSSAGQISQ